MVYEVLCLFALGGIPRTTTVFAAIESPPAMIYDFPGNKSHEPIIVVVSGYNQERNILPFPRGGGPA
jgi:hypothetical protein